MQVSSANDIKIYSLTSGKSLPDWIEETKRRKKNDKPSHASNAIQLIQDFDMPVVSNKVAISRDERYVVAVGTYKPRMKCFDVRDLGVKFERCFDSESVAFEYLSDDYSKLVFLHCNRFVSVHAQFGNYYKLRIPKNGRDLAYLRHSCEAHFCGEGADVYRINLEQGRFMAPYALATHAGGNVIAHNEEHQLTCIGTAGGTVEAWDSRSHQRVGLLDCAQMSGEDITSLPEVTALAFRDSLTFGVGNSAGYVSLFDLRSPSPVLTKDHMYGLPIKKIRFHEGLGQVMSLDAKGIKIWDSKSGEAFTSIESKSELNDFDIFPRSGLIVSANEQPRLQVHYLPSLGPAPRWCSFLDNITEELEESATADVYDNYKFLTRAQLEALELDHLIGTPLLRAYMHGYFIDVRLYRKAQALAGPVDSEYKSKYVEEKVRKEMAEKQRRVEAKKKNKPSVNAELFERLQEQEEEEEAGVQTAKKSKKAAAAPILKDERFKPMFENVDFTIDPDEDAYKLINPVLSKMKESKANKKAASTREMEEAAVEAEGISGSEEADSDSMADDDSDSSEEEEMPKRKKKSNAAETSLKEAKTYSLKDVSEMPTKSSKKDRMSLSSRLDRMGEEATAQTMKRHADGSHSMTFKKTASKKEMAAKIKNEKHMEERRKLRRSAGALKNRKALRN